MLFRSRLYTTRWCGFCVRAKTLLDRLGYAYEEVGLDDDPDFHDTLAEVGAGRTLPQVLIGEQAVGGYAELARLASSGALAQRLGRGDEQRSDGQTA